MSGAERDNQGFVTQDLHVPVPTRKVEFTNVRGVRLAGSLDLPGDGAVRAGALLAHCFTCNSNYRFIRALSRVLAEQGIAVLRFDFTGLGNSGGRFEDSNFTTNIEDIEAAAVGFADATGTSPQLLIGHSLGGTAMLAAAARLASVRAIVTINAPFTPDHILEHLEGAVTGAERDGVAEAEIGGQRYRITPQLIADLRSAQPRAAITALDAALLILHSPVDQTVGIEHAARIFEAARQPKSFVVLDGADHLLGRESDVRYAGRLISAWASAYLRTS